MSSDTNTSYYKGAMLKRINKACSYFPCHQGLEDCTFCYCPFYPCEDKKLGKFVYFRKGKKNVWSCQGCAWIHRKSVVDSIFILIRKNQTNIKST